MILLLDAHVVLWSLSGAASLTPSTAATIADPVNDVLVSAASVWEIEVKRAAGRLRAPDDILEALRVVGFETIAVTAADAVAAATLPARHADPFDRMLVAQARRLAAVIVSRHEALSAYEGVDILPA